MALTPQELQERSVLFALRVLKLFRALPKTDEARIFGRQLLRAATSVAANYRAVCRARSRPEFISKLGLVIEETDESVFWLEFLVRAEIVTASRVTDLSAEGNALLRIFSASRETARRNSRQRKSPGLNQKSKIENQKL